jgi:hypothetical protein
MALQISGNQGVTGKVTGQGQVISLGEFGDELVTELMPRYYENTYRGNTYTFGISNTALVAANAIATGVTATAQPIIGVWNPLTSLVNLVILKLFLNITTIANTAVSPAGFMFLTNTGQSAISTGSTPINCKTLVAAGSSAKAFAISTALTGMVGSLVVLHPTGINTIQAAGPATAAPQPSNFGLEEIDGSIIIPPGGVLAIMGQASTTTISVNSGMKWAELPV